MTDHEAMTLALVEARAAADAGEVPIGAVVLRDRELITRTRNSVITLNDPTAHAEILALRAAGNSLGNYRLTGCTLFTTLEPCTMCAGALIHARIERLVYAASDPKAGAAGSALSVINHERLNHQMLVVSGLLADEAGELLRKFFRERR